MSSNNYTKSQSLFLICLRVLIGWHFLYEGCTKLMSSGWSAKGFLLDSGGIFAGLFKSMAYNETVLDVVNFTNIWGLTLIGLGLILGIFAKYAKIGGILILALYYLSHPPLIGVEYALPSEGSYLIVNKNLIELFAIVVLMYFPTSHIIGFDRIICKLRNK